MRFELPRRRPSLLIWVGLLALATACVNPAGSGVPSTAKPQQSVPRAADDQQMQPVNLVPNSTFESGTADSWVIDQHVTISNTDPHSGRWSAQIDSAGSGSTGMDTNLATSIGTTYKLTAWVRIVSEAGSDWGGFRIQATSWDWVSLANSGPLLVVARNTAWFKVALTFTATTPQTRLQIGYFGGPSFSQIVQIDDIALFVKGANQPPTISVALTPNALDGLPDRQQFRIDGDDADGTIVRMLWDFGDGTRSLIPNGSRNVTLPGHYSATVRVADDDGAVVTKTINWTATSSDYPSLSITTPAEPMVMVASSTIDLHGNTSGAVTSVRVSSDRGFMTTARGTDTWNVQVKLQPGYNRLLVQAADERGQISTAERMVQYIPGAELNITNITESTPTIERWTPLALTFMLENSAATDPHFPYDPAPAPGLEWIDGVSIEALFTPDDWQTIYRRPAFLDQRYDRERKSDQEWLYPTGDPIWTVRFAPPTVGIWKYRLEATEARGTAQSAQRSFTVTEAGTPNNHGPVGIAAHDSRYFEYADGTPFLGSGHNIGFVPESFSYNAIDQFDKIGSGNQQFFRSWLGGNIWGSAWQPWNSITTGYAGYLPATSLTLDRAYGNGLAALKLDTANPIVLQGWNTGHIGLIPGRTYRLRVRWRTEGISGPQTPGQPYGVTIKLTGWIEPGKTSALPVLVPHVQNDTPWHVDETDFTASDDYISNVALILENTTAGAAYVDEIDLFEVLQDGQLGPQLLRAPKLNSLFTFEPRRAAGLDTILSIAAERGMSFSLVISEKDEYLLNHFGPDGLPDPLGGHFSERENTPTHRLHEYYWRYLFARFGAFQSVHSWELVNEAAPEFNSQFQLTADLAHRAAADGNPHMVTTSTWATLAESAWKEPASTPISYVNFHAYVRTTGWLEPKEELANDVAQFFSAYDQAAQAAGFGKPVVWGEQGIDNNGGPEPLLADDQHGVWLHKLTWARCGPGGSYPLYW